MCVVVKFRNCRYDVRASMRGRLLGLPTYANDCLLFVTQASAIIFHAKLSLRAGVVGNATVRGICQSKHYRVEND